MKYTLKVATRLQDNGDGGYTLYVYNNTDELLTNHPNTRRWDGVLKKEVTVELTEQEKRDILTENDPYKNGYIGSSTIEIEIENDMARLTKPLHFHSGQ